MARTSIKWKILWTKHAHDIVDVIFRKKWSKYKRALEESWRLSNCIL